MGRRFKVVWALATSLIVATGVAPLAASPAAAATSTVTVSQQTYSTSSPACTFTMVLTETLSNATVTGLHHHTTASCPGLLGVSMDLSNSIIDLSAYSAGVTASGPYSGVGNWVASADQPISNASSATADLDYMNPKTAHAYDGTLLFDAYLPDGFTAAQDQHCSQTGQFWHCSFDQYATPASAPNVGPDPTLGTATHTLTVPFDTSGGTCQLITDLQPSGPATLSFTGRTICPPGSSLGGGDIYAYGDRKEVSELGAGSDYENYGYPNESISGQIPAVKGRTYTATFYVLVNIASGPIPPECSLSGYVGGNGYDCEVSASVVF